MLKENNRYFEEIVSFEDNLHLNHKMFEDFHNNNSKNILIEGNINFKRNNNPDITIIITIYNQAHCLHTGLRSVQNQSLKNLEIIIIDDCSLDNSTEVIKEYQKEDERIILISHDTNEGEIKSRNDGIRIAKGKYITIIDGDDALIHKDILKNSLYIEEKAELDVVEFPAGIFTKGKFKELVNNYNNINISYIIYQPELKTKFFYKRYNRYYIQNRVIWSKIIKKELFINALDYLGDGVADDYINEAEDTLMVLGIFHLAKSYYIMKEMGYYYSFGEKKNKYPQSTNRICKTNNKLKKMGWYKYLKFLVDKNSATKKEKLITYNEFRLINNKKIFNLNLDSRHYQLMFYVWNKILKFDNLSKKQKKYITRLKSKAIKRIKKEKNIKVKY